MSAAKLTGSAATPMKPLLDPPPAAAAAEEDGEAEVSVACGAAIVGRAFLAVCWAVGEARGGLCGGVLYVSLAGDFSLVTAASLPRLAADLPGTSVATRRVHSMSPATEKDWHDVIMTSTARTIDEEMYKKNNNNDIVIRATIQQIYNN